jgi:hypothetical protein
MTPTEILTISISRFSLLVSLIVGYLTFFIGFGQLKLLSRIEFHKMLLELNKELLRDPNLRAYRDEYRSKMNIEITEVHRSQIEAMLVSIINLLELVFLYTGPHKKSITKADKDEWDMWQKYFQKTLKDSSFLRLMLQNESIKEVYHPKFISWACDQLREVERVTPTISKSG